MSSPERVEVGQALSRLDAITRRLRAECPWDREQDERSIVPHTVEEAYELADAAQRGDDAKLLDELGDVLFQVYFLALLLEERGQGSLAEVAEHCTEKLIRRHPHVFGEAEASTAREVLHNWDRIKRTEAGREPGVFGEVPENLPSLLYARKVQRRAAMETLEPEEAVGVVHGEIDQIVAARTREEQFTEVGDALFSAVALARQLAVDPELALRAAADRFRDRVSSAGDLAASEQRSWNDLRPSERLNYYVRALAAERE